MATGYESLAPPPAMPSALPVVPPSRVTVVDFDMPFGSMVTLMIKWGIAAIPAVLILAMVVFMVSAALFAIVAGLGAGLAGVRR